MYDHDEEPDIIYLPPKEDEAPYWTLRRILFVAITLILILALLATLVWPLLWQIANPPPPPPTPPLSNVGWPSAGLWPAL